MLPLAADYFIFVFISAIGAIQVGASCGKLRGIYLFRNIIITRIVGFLSVIVGIVWFYATKHRNINDTEGGIDANDQALWFFLGVTAALIFTFLITSIFQKKLTEKSQKNFEPSIQNLKYSTYFFAIKNSIGFRTKNWWN